MKSFGQVTLSDVKKALQELGGEDYWVNILDQVTKNRNNDYSYYLNLHSYKTTAKQVLCNHCPTYANYKGVPHFKKINGKFRLITKAGQL